MVTKPATEALKASMVVGSCYLEAHTFVCALKWQFRRATKTGEVMKRQLSEHAAAAKQIRTILKKAFPKTKFRVVSDSYAGGDSVYIRWEDGPTDNAVKELTHHYQEGHFNGMEDIYEYSNDRDDIPQTKHVLRNRSFSEGARMAKKAELVKLYGIKDPESDPEWREKTNDWRDYAINKELHKETIYPDA